MGNSKKVFEDILDDFDSRTDSIHEEQIESALSKLKKDLDNDKKEIPDDIVKEIMAFGFIEDYRDEKTGWGTYFGPMIVLPNQSGQMVEYPSIRLVNTEILQYWTTRSKEVKHPVLKARYAGLVWDFFPKVVGENADPEMARLVVGSNIEIANKKLHKYESSVISKLERALSLSLSLNDSKYLEKVKKSIIDYEDYIATDDKLGLWGFSFDLLIENKKISLTEQQEKKIISDLEERLKRVSDINNEDKIDPFASEHAALRLAKYYQRKNQSEDVKRILLKYGNSFMKMSEKVTALVGSSWLQKVYSTYLQFGLKSEADKVALSLAKINKKTPEELKSVSNEMKIPKEKLDDYISSMLKGDIEQIFDRIAFHFIPRKEEAETQVKELSSKYPIRYLVSTVIQDQRGHPVATVGPIEEDLNGHIIRQICQNMSISDYFLGLSLENLHKKFKLSIEKLLEYLYKSPVFTNEKKSVFIIGLKAYFKNDFVVASHILIPHIEDSFRNLLELSGKAVYKPGRHGGLFLKTFDEILRDKVISKVFGGDAALYLRILFTDQRGFNLRNNICHGIISPQFISSEIANRIFHSLLLLGQVRKVKKEEARS